MFKLNNNIQLEQLVKYMLLKNNLVDLSEYSKDSISKIAIKPVLPKVKHSELYCKYNNKYNGSYYRNNKLKQYDCLFWCFFDIYSELDANKYFLNLTNNDKFKLEKEFKLNFIEKMRNSKGILKQNGLKLTNLEGEFSSSNKISLDGFNALCILYNIPFILAKDNITYYRFNFSILDIEDLYTNCNYKDINILWMKEGSYTICEDVTVDIIDNIIKNYYYIKNYNKPLTAISSYKVDDLVIIAHQLSINVYRDECKNRYIKKQELYETIYKKII